MKSNSRNSHICQPLKLAGSFAGSRELVTRSPTSSCYLPMNEWTLYQSMFGLVGHCDKRISLWKLKMSEHPACPNSVAISVRMPAMRSNTSFIIGGCHIGKQDDGRRILTAEI